MSSKTAATLDDLYRIPEHQKAELIEGEIVLMSPTGFFPGRVAGKIFASLHDYERQNGGGYAIPDNVGFVVNLPGRQSFSPDAAWYTGQPSGMKFVDGAPTFAVEVRSDGDYGPQAERNIARKIAEYFAAGTLVVWDVDLLDEDMIRVHRAGETGLPTVYRRGDTAEAEPAVPGWRLVVDTVLQS